MIYSLLKSIYEDEDSVFFLAVNSNNTTHVLCNDIDPLEFLAVLRQHVKEELIPIDKMRLN